MKKIKKEKKFDLDDFIKKSKSDKKKYIITKSKTIQNPKKLEKKLHNSWKFGEIYISNFKKDVEVININNRDNYMDKELSDDEDTIIGDNKIKFRNNSSVKDAINNSIDYLKNSMYYFALFKNYLFFK